MSGYEVEHDVPTEAQHSSRRPDMSTFFSTLREVETTGDTETSNAHVLPMPENVTAVFRLLAESIQQMAGDAGNGSDAQQNMIEQLLFNAHNPPDAVKGVPESFFVDLDRVPKSQLKKGEDCPICGQPFLDDPYPLVVRLPCHADHKFDLECIRPWLKINITCPLDRKELIKPKAPPPAPDPEEEEFNDMYG